MVAKLDFPHEAWATAREKAIQEQRHNWELPSCYSKAGTIFVCGLLALVPSALMLGMTVSEAFRNDHPVLGSPLLWGLSLCCGAAVLEGSARFRARIRSRFQSRDELLREWEERHPEPASDDPVRCPDCHGKGGSLVELCGRYDSGDTFEKFVECKYCCGLGWITRARYNRNGVLATVVFLLATIGAAWFLFLMFGP